MSKKAIFLDRDGVINKEVNYLYKIKDFEFIDGVFESCQHFQKLGYEILVVTNQSGISRGFYSDKDYLALNMWMLRQFNDNNIKILGTFYCPHGPKQVCECRKPKSGMFLQANKNHNIDMKNSWMIGDKETDIQAANSAGILNTILVRSGHKIIESSSKADFIIDSIINSKLIITK